MSYGKFAPKHNNSFDNTAYNDPMFALGQLLSSNWSKNYEDRGRTKALAEIEAQLSPNPTQQETAAATQEKQASNEAAARQTLNPLDTQQIISLAGQYGDVKNNVSNSYLNDTNNFAGDNGFAKYMRNSAQETQGQVQALKTLGYIPKTVDEAAIAALDNYAGTLQPVTGSDGEIAGLGKTTGSADIADQSASKRLANFNADNFVADQTVNLLKKGYSKDDIETMLAPIALKAKTLQGQQDEAVIQQLLPLYTSLQNSGKYNEANQLMLMAYKKNPEVVKALINGNVSAKDQYAEANAEKKQQQNLVNSKDLAGFQFGLQQTGADNDVLRYEKKTGITSAAKQAEINAKINLLKSVGYSEKDASALAYGVAGGTKGLTNSGVTTQQYQAAKATMEDYNKWLASNLDPKAAYPGGMGNVEIAQQIMTAALYGGPQNSQNTSNSNAIDYKTAMTDWTKALDKNSAQDANMKWAKKDLIKKARLRYGDMADELINDTNWEAYGL